jgi:hypothetical protein
VGHFLSLFLTDFRAAGKGYFLLSMAANPDPG